MAVPVSIPHKVGDTFRARVVYRDTGGDPVDLRTAGLTIASAVKAKGLPPFPLAYEQRDQDADRGAFDLVAETAAWPTGQLAWDIQFTSANGTVSTKTMFIVAEADVTP